MNTRCARAGLSVALLLLALSGCAKQSPSGGKPAEGSGPQQPSVASTQAPSRGPDPCSLLDPKEVETVMGALAGPPYRSREESDDNEPSDNGDACVYETPDFSNIRMTVVWEDGSSAFNTINIPSRIFSGAKDEMQTAAKTLLPGAVQIEGEWDEATSLGCCQIYALRGDRLVTFDFRGWRAQTELAVGLLNKALLRLDKPLSIDGRAGNAAARQRVAMRPPQRPACSLLSRAEVEAVIGPLLNPPHPDSSKDGTGCVYRYTQAASREPPWKGEEAPEQFTSLLSGLTGGKTGLVAGPVEVTITVLWRGGFRQMHDNSQIAGAVAGAMAGIPGMPKRTEGKVAGGSWTEASQTRINFTAVSKDVGITIDTDPTLSEEQVELRRRLVGKAIEKIFKRSL